MPSFKEVALRILSNSDRPLHSKEIAKRILRAQLVKSSGKTPERTIYTALYRDIMRHKDKSRFIRTGNGYFSLNPSYSDDKHRK